MVRPAGLRSPLWKSPTAFMTMALLIGGAVYWALIHYNQSQYEQREYGQSVIGEITKVLGTSAIIRRPESPTVEVTLPDGSEHRIRLKDFRAIGCGLGMKIEVREYQGRYVLGPNGCNITENHTR